ncbi:hypothetical protein pipiens_001428 [Culex pipiens pipiens]|uniref:NADH dehydrogenase [ubiquinone] 1 beta subcomplex subunit 10 n=1 Tax=Culex pipiens pipiens TaxID=38569 RepID=A0ABD1CUW8_CULPP
MMCSVRTPNRLTEYFCHRLTVVVVGVFSRYGAVSKEQNFIKFPSTMPEAPARNPLESFMNSIASVVDGPVTWFRESVVEPNRKTYPWYHQKFRRVPTIDQCYTDDAVCFFEANNQFKRDK